MLGDLSADGANALADAIVEMRAMAESCIVMCDGSGDCEI